MYTIQELSQLRERVSQIQENIINFFRMKLNRLPDGKEQWDRMRREQVDIIHKLLEKLPQSEILEKRKLLREIAFACRDLGNWSQATGYWLDALAVVEDHRESFTDQELCKACSDVAFGLGSQEQLQEAELYYRKGTEVFGGIPKHAERAHVIDVDGKPRVNTVLLHGLASNLEKQTKFREAENVYRYLLDYQRLLAGTVSEFSESQEVHAAVEAFGSAFTESLAQLAVNIARMLYMQERKQMAREIIIENMPQNLDGAKVTKDLLVREQLLRILSDIDKEIAPSYKLILSAHL